MNVEAEVNKFRTCKDHDELLRQIKKYKNLAVQHAANLVTAGQYSSIALKLQEIHDKLPAQKLKKPITSNTQKVTVKTASISKEEQKKIDDEWKNKVKT